jgi:hypothetical protein
MPAVLIHGATGAGIVAAIAAARSGAGAVTLVACEQHIGGMLTGGLQHTDSANASVIGGITRELFVRIEQQYPGRSTNASYPPGHSPPGWLFESHVAQSVVDTMLQEANVSVVRGAGGVRSILRKGTRLVSMETFGSADELKADIFIDASYEGDLLAAAGTSMTWGRESVSMYNESSAGRRPGKKIGGLTINPYWDASVAEPEPLPHVAPELPVGIGEADAWIEPYDFRLCFTNSPGNKVPLRRPPAYNSSTWELWRRLYRAKPPSSLAEAGLSCLGPIPNSYGDCGKQRCKKCDMLGMQHGTDLTNGAWGYPNGTRQEREAIRLAHVDFIEGLLWFWLTDTSVPAVVREELAQYGHCADEYSAASTPPHWPPQLYVREARRLVGDFVWTEHPPHESKRARSIGLGSYTFDCHTVSRIIHRTGVATNDYVVVEGRVNDGADGRPRSGVVQRPFEIPYDALLPKATEATNLLAACALSTSHLRFNALRMEPTWMVIGQAAGVAAAMAVVGSSTGHKPCHKPCDKSFDKPCDPWCDHHAWDNEEPPVNAVPRPLHSLNIAALQSRLEHQGQRIWP